MKIIDKEELKQLVLDGITTKDLNDNYDYSHIGDMNKIFKNCKSLVTIPELDTKNVTDMSGMFIGCTSLTKIPYLEVKKVKSMYSMFNGCEVLNEIPYLETENVKDMSFMFSGCKKITTIPELETENVKDMSFMFSGCTSLTDLPYLETKNVTNMSYMFYGCTSLSANLSNWNVGRVNDVKGMFEDTTINPTILNWDLPSLKKYNFQERLTKKEFTELKKEIGRLGDLIVFL